MWRWAILLGGCNAVFGIHAVGEDGGAGDDAPIGSIRVVVHSEVTIIEPDDSGGYAPPHDEPIETTFDVTLDDGTKPMITVESPGVISFERATGSQEYRLAYMRGDAGNFPVTLVGTANEIYLSQPLFGRQNRVAPTVSTPVMISFPTAMTDMYVFSTGLRTSKKVNDTPNPVGAVGVDWLTMPSLSGTTGLLEASKSDTIFLAQYALVSGVGAYYTIEKIDAQVISLTNGATHSLSLTPQAPLFPRCARLTATRAEEENRLVAATNLMGPRQSRWTIESTPNPMIARNGGILLALEDTFASEPSPTIDVAYHNPFPGERQVVRLYAEITSDVFGIAVTSFSQTFQPLPLTPTCDASSAVTVTGSVAIPTGIAIDFAKHEITFNAEGNVDYFVIDLYDVSDGQLVLVARFLTFEPRVEFDAGLVVVGRHYVVRAVTALGNPLARSGDFRPIAYPAGQVSVYSDVFGQPL